MWFHVQIGYGPLRFVGMENQEVSTQTDTLCLSKTWTYWTDTWLKYSGKTQIVLDWVCVDKNSSDIPQIDPPTGDSTVIRKKSVDNIGGHHSILIMTVSSCTSIQ